MDGLKQHEKVSLNNYQAHLEVILGNVESANKQLTAVLKNRDTALADYADAKRAYDNAVRGLADIQKESAAEQNKISAKRIDLAKAQENIKTERSDHDAHILSTSAKQTKELNKHNDRVAAAQNKLAELDILVGDRSKELSELLDKVTDAAATVAKLNKEETLTRERIATLESDEAEAQKNHKLAVDAREKELSDLDAKIEASKKAVETPHRLLDEREAAVSVREEDARIVAVRLQAQHKEIHPDQELNI